MAWPRSIRFRYSLRALLVSLTLFSVLAASKDALPAGGQEVGGAPVVDAATQKRVGELIAVFGDGEARGKKLDQVNQASDELVSIGLSGVPQLVSAVVSAKDDTDTTGAYSANVLDKIGKPAAPLVAALSEPLNEEDRWKLMRFRGKFDYKAAIPFALESLTSPNEIVRLQAVRYVGQHKEAAAREQLLTKLNVDSPRLRWHIIDALGQIGGDGVVPALIDLLRADSWAAKGEGLMVPDGHPPAWWPDGRPYVVKAIQSLNAVSAGPALVSMLRETGSGTGYLGPIIMPVLRDLNYVASSPELRLILCTDSIGLARTHDAAGIHACAAMGLWKFGDRLGRAALIPFLLNRPPGTGHAIEYSWSNLSDRGDLWLLARLLNPPSGFACKAMERVTGISKRAPGHSASSEYDSPLWADWYAKHRHELSTMAFPWPRADRAKKPDSDAQQDSQRRELTQDQFEVVWSALAVEEQAPSFRAMQQLVRSPRTVGFLASRLEPITEITPQRLKQLFEKLDADDFTAREFAETELERIGRKGLSELRTAVPSSLAPEAALRMQRLLDRLNDRVPIRAIRAVAVLEEIGSADAVHTLRNIAEGDRESCVALEAAAAVERLGIAEKK